MAGFIAIAGADSTIGEEINIASAWEISVGELAREVIRQINPAAAVRCDNDRLRPENSEVERLIGANDKIQRLTGWRPRYSFADGLAETIDWFRDPGNFARYTADHYTV